MYSARRLIVLCICVKFRDNILNGFQLTEPTRVYDRNGYVQCTVGNNSKSRQIQLQFMCSARRPIVLYICVKLGRNISDSIVRPDRRTFPRSCIYWLFSLLKIPNSTLKARGISLWGGEFDPRFPVKIKITNNISLFTATDFLGADEMSADELYQTHVDRSKELAQHVKKMARDQKVIISNITLYRFLKRSSHFVLCFSPRNFF